MWAFEAEDLEQAKALHRWMDERPGEWRLWANLAVGLGDRALRTIIVDEAERAFREQAACDAMERDEELERARLAGEIKLYILDGKGARPGLSLESADSDRPFWKMRFSEKWERERVLDWMRWQKEHFVRWRDHLDRHGSASLERLMMEGMRSTERDVKMRGLASAGRRPLRFWRGE